MSVAVNRAPLRFRNRLERFMGGRPELPLQDQLETMQQFWRLVGLEVPTPSAEQTRSLESHVITRGRQRVIPVPFLLPGSRLRLAKRTLDLVEQTQPTLVTAPGGVLDKLGAAPSSDSSEAARRVNKYHKLCYRLPTAAGDRYVTRKQFVGTMLANNRMIQRGTGKQASLPWLFPVIDVESPRTYRNLKHARKHSNRQIRQLGPLVNPAVTPDGLLVVEVLDVLNGLRRPANEVTFGNEYIYDVGKQAVASMVGISRGETFKGIELITRPLNYTDKSYGVRVGSDGLVPRPAAP